MSTRRDTSDQTDDQVAGPRTARWQKRAKDTGTWCGLYPRVRGSKVSRMQYFLKGRRRGRTVYGVSSFPRVGSNFIVDYR